MRSAADAIAASHDSLEATIAAATKRYSQMADRYGALLPRIAAVDTSLDALATTTAGVTNSTLTLPTHVSLPAVQAAPRIVRVAAPATQATTERLRPLTGMAEGTLTRFEARAMGSALRLTVWPAGGDAEAVTGAAAWTEVVDEFERSEQAMSRFRETPVS